MPGAASWRPTLVFVRTVVVGCRSINVEDARIRYRYECAAIEFRCIQFVAVLVLDFEEQDIIRERRTGVQFFVVRMIQTYNLNAVNGCRLADFQRFRNRHAIRREAQITGDDYLFAQIERRRSGHFNRQNAVGSRYVRRRFADLEVGVPTFSCFFTILVQNLVCNFRLGVLRRTVSIGGESKLVALELQLRDFFVFCREFRNDVIFINTADRTVVSPACSFVVSSRVAFFLSSEKTALSTTRTACRSSQQTWLSNRQFAWLKVTSIFFAPTAFADAATASNSTSTLYSRSLYVTVIVFLPSFSGSSSSTSTSPPSENETTTFVALTTS